MLNYAVFRSIYIILSIYLAYIDIKAGYVSRLLLWGAIGVSCVGQFLLGGNFALLYAILGSILGVVVFFLAFFVSGKKLGLADVWYAGLMGSALGPVWWFPAVFIACFVALIYYAITRSRQPIPFIPCMAIGSILILLVGWNSLPGV
jgi:prepilin signal peptidase PulO-like enzyme (type II secretory pathway)